MFDDEKFAAIMAVLERIALALEKRPLEKRPLSATEQPEQPRLPVLGSCNLGLNLPCLPSCKGKGVELYCPRSPNYGSEPK